MSHTYAPLHERPEIHQRRWFILGVMCLCLVLVVMTVSSLNVALPTMQRELEATATALQWIVDSYAIVFAGLLLTAGAIGDRFGRKGALLSGLVLFGAGALVSGLATTAGVVIIGRVISGIGAAFVMPSTLSIITSVFPPQERRQAIAVWAGFAGAGGAIGPIVSGLLLEHFWWGSAVLVNIPVVVLVAVAIAIFTPTSRDDTDTPLDPFGALLSLVGLSALLFAIIEGPERGWTDGLVVAGFVVAAVVIAGFLAWERRAPHPMLPLDLFQDRRFTVGAGVITTAFFIMFGFFFMFTQYVQFARGYSALDAGIAALPFPAMMILVAPRSARLAHRLGTGPVVATGFTLVACGFGILSVITPDTPYLALALALVLMGSGMAITGAPATGSIMSAVPVAKAGIGSAVNDTTRELGGALGIAVLGSIVNASYRSQVDFSGTGVPAEASAAGEESVGAAIEIAHRLGDAGRVFADRAGEAFTNAFNNAAMASVAIALGAAALLVLTFSPRKERAAVAAAPPHYAPRAPETPAEVAAPSEVAP